MKRKDRISKNEKNLRICPLGFSLIEIIVTLILVGIMAAMIIPFFASGVTSSHTPIQIVSNTMDLNTVMANIVEDYERNYLHDLDGLKTHITGNDGYGTYSVQEKIFVKFSTSGSLEDIDAAPGDEDYGTYLKVTITNGEGDTLTHLFTHKNNG